MYNWEILLYYERVLGTQIWLQLLRIMRSHSVITYEKWNQKWNDHDRISTHKVATITMKTARIIYSSLSIDVDIDMFG